MERRWVIGAAAAVVLGAGLALRLWHLTSEPLWLDEAYSAFAADHGFGFLWRVVPLYETHPPFYYSLLHLWVLAFGDGLRTLRLFGLIAGVATLPVTAAAADAAGQWLGWDREKRRWLAFTALGLGSLSLAMVEMAREVRPYPLLILVYAGALLMLLRLGGRARRGQSIAGGDLLLYLLLLAAMLWLHNLGPLYGVALTIALGLAVVRRDLGRRDWLWLAGGHALVALCYLPGLLILRAQAGTWMAATWLRFVADELFFDRVLTLYAVPGWPALGALLLAGLAAGVLARTAGRLLAVLIVTALLPLVLVVLLSITVTPLFITRTMTPLAAPAIIILSIGAVGARQRLLGAGIAVLLGASMFAADIQVRAGGPMQDWYRAVDWLAAGFAPGDQVFAYPNEGKLPLFYALRDRGLHYSIRAIPTDVPALEIRHGWHPSGTRGVSSLPRTELRAIANEPASRAVPTIWLLRLGAETFDPGDGLLKELRRNRVVVRRYRDGPIDIVALRRQPAPDRSPR